MHQGGNYGCPLGAAADGGNVDAMKWLLEKGADPNLMGLQTIQHIFRCELIFFLQEELRALLSRLLLLLHLNGGTGLSVFRFC